MGGEALCRDSLLTYGLFCQDTVPLMKGHPWIQTDYRILWLYVIPKAEKKPKYGKNHEVFLLEDGGGQDTVTRAVWQNKPKQTNST